MRAVHVAFLAALLPVAAAQAQAVKAPPLPPGSNMVRIEPGLNPDEKKRSIRAHHHKAHVAKDVTADDTANGGRAVSKKKANTNGAKK
jgi:hypothetical protein